VEGGSLGQPFLFMVSGNGHYLEQGVYDHAAGPAYLVTVKGTQHYNFTDMTLASPLAQSFHLSGPINGDQMVRIMNAYTLAFFDKHLRDLAAPLLNGISADFPRGIASSRGTPPKPLLRLRILPTGRTYRWSGKPPLIPPVCSRRPYFRITGGWVVMRHGLKNLPDGPTRTSYVQMRIERIAAAANGPNLLPAAYISTHFEMKSGFACARTARTTSAVRPRLPARCSSSGMSAPLAAGVPAAMWNRHPGQRVDEGRSSGCFRIISILP